MAGITWTALRLAETDNVATALRDLAAGDLPAIAGITAPALITDIKRGHKFALAPIPAGGDVRKYGHVVGLATQAIDAGDHVHLHNLEGLAGRDERWQQKK